MRSAGYMQGWVIYGHLANFQACNVISCPIQSIHPRIGNPNVREDLNRTVFCIDNALNTRKAVKLLWTPMQVKKDS